MSGEVNRRFNATVEAARTRTQLFQRRINSLLAEISVGILTIVAILLSITLKARGLAECGGFGTRFESCLFINLVKVYSSDLITIVAKQMTRGLLLRPRGTAFTIPTRHADFQAEKVPTGAY